MKIVEPSKKYTFWLKGGHVVDPSQNIDEVRDILISGSKIVPLPENGVIDASDVKEVINCEGYHVFPGLIDEHVHFSWNTSGITPDLFCLPSCVTSACDAGSIGTNAFENFVKYRISSAITTLKACVNITSGGLAGKGYMEDISPELYDVEAMEYLFERYRDYIVGFKLRIGKDISEGMGLRPLEESVKMARKFDTRLSLHATYPLEPVSDIVSIMGKGDILCHSFQEKGPFSIIDDKGNVLPEVWEARKRGVIFDCAQGRIHLSYNVAKKAIEQGFLPDVISTDLITFSAYQDRLFSLPVTMSRYLALGMNLKDVIKAVTESPAKIMGMEGQIGTLKAGALADVAIMKLKKHDFTFTDSQGNSLNAHEMLLPQMTIKAGRTVYKNIEFCDLMR